MKCGDAACDLLYKTISFDVRCYLCAKNVVKNTPVGSFKDDHGGWHTIHHDFQTCMPPDAAGFYARARWCEPSGAAKNRIPSARASRSARRVILGLCTSSAISISLIPRSKPSKAGAADSRKRTNDRSIISFRLRLEVRRGSSAWRRKKGGNAPPPNWTSGEGGERRPPGDDPLDPRSGGRRSPRRGGGYTMVGGRYPWGCIFRVPCFGFPFVRRAFFSEGGTHCRYLSYYRYREPPTGSCIEPCPGVPRLPCGEKADEFYVFMFREIYHVLLPTRSGPSMLVLFSLPRHSTSAWCDGDFCFRIAF